MKVSYLTFRFFAGNSVPLLYSADELILFSFNDLPIIVGQFTPLLLCFPDELFPVALDLVGVHLRSFRKLTLLINSDGGPEFPYRFEDARALAAPAPSRRSPRADGEGGPSYKDR
jgi:hypothetical protein